MPVKSDGFIFPFIHFTYFFIIPGKRPILAEFIEIKKIEAF